MRSLNRWGLAAALAGLSLAGPAWGQGKSADAQSAAKPDAATAAPAASSGTGTASHGSSAKAHGKLSDGLATVHAINQGEVAMGQMGVSTSQNEQVKAFSQQMIDDHGKNDEQLQQLAQTAGLSLTGKAFDKTQAKGQKQMQSLHGKTGHDFDQAFMAAMVKGHQSAANELGTLTKEAKKEKQAEVVSYLEATHTAVQGHLTKAKEIDKELKKGSTQASKAGTSHATGTGSSAGATGTGAGGAANSNAATGGDAAGAAHGGAGATSGDQGGQKPTTK